MYKLTEQSLESIANEALEVCRNLNLDIGKNFVFKINKRATSYAGKCRKENDDTFRIEICERFSNVKGVTRKKLVEVMLHELIHTIPNCWNHGKNFKEQMEKINYATDYNVSTREINPNIAEEKMKSARFIFECKKCGKKYFYQRACNTVFIINSNPMLATCGKCNTKGSLVLIEKDGKPV